MTKTRFLNEGKVKFQKLKKKNSPLYAPVHILDDPSSFPQLRKYLMDGLPLNKKTTFEYRIH